MDDPRVRAVLFRSEERFDAFRDRLDRRGVDCTVLSFDDPAWVDFDFGDVDLAIYYPSFSFSSNHPLALSRVKDDLMHVHARNPRAAIYPDPCLVPFYNDKYRQFLFLHARGFPIPPTVPLVSEAALDLAAESLGFPLVLKNRFGAGGEAVFLARDRKQLRERFEVSRLNLWSRGGLRHVWGQLSRRESYYWLLRARRARYPLLSWPLLAQKFLSLDRDLKTVVGLDRVVEGHWRIRADPSMWRMNIDGGGIGEWSRIPEPAIELSERLAAELGSRWLNVDLMPQGDAFLIGEFSPVWHHYRYREKPDFVYRDDYNVPVPLERALDLETLIVDSLLEAVRPSAGRR